MRRYGGVKGSETLDDGAGVQDVELERTDSSKSCHSQPRPCHLALPSAHKATLTRLPSLPPPRPLQTQVMDMVAAGDLSLLPLIQGIRAGRRDGLRGSPSFSTPAIW